MRILKQPHSRGSLVRQRCWNERSLCDGAHWCSEERKLRPRITRDRRSYRSIEFARIGTAADDRVRSAIVLFLLLELGTCRVVADTAARRHAYDFNYQATVRQK